MERTDISTHLEELPEWWVLKPIESGKSLADLVFTPTSFVRRIDWNKVHEVCRNPWPAYALVTMGEGVRLILYGLALHKPLYLDIAKSIYEKLQ